MYSQNRHGFAPFESPLSEVKPDKGELLSEAVFSRKVTRKKRPEANLKLQYRKTLERSLALTLTILITIFQLARQFSITPSELETVDVIIEVADIPPTEQIKRAPPPPRPSIPVPTESEDVPEDITIESTDLDLSELPPPPPPPSDRFENYQFIAYDEPPEVIGGYAAIRANLKYPEIAKKAGVEAKVVVGVLIDEKGNSVKTQILSSTHSIMGFNEAAQKAIMGVKWKPAKQRDKPVKVWVSMPIKFSLEVQS